MKFPKLGEIWYAYREDINGGEIEWECKKKEQKELGRPGFVISDEVIHRICKQSILLPIKNPLNPPEFFVEIPAIENLKKYNYSIILCAQMSNFGISSDLHGNSGYIADSKPIVNWDNQETLKFQKIKEVQEKIKKILKFEDELHFDSYKGLRQGAIVAVKFDDNGKDVYAECVVISNRETIISQKWYDQIIHKPHCLITVIRTINFDENIDLKDDISIILKDGESNLTRKRIISLPLIRTIDAEFRINKDKDKQSFAIIGYLSEERNHEIITKLREKILKF